MRRHAEHSAQDFSELDSYFEECALAQREEEAELQRRQAPFHRQGASPMQFTLAHQDPNSTSHSQNMSLGKSNSKKSLQHQHSAELFGAFIKVKKKGTVTSQPLDRNTSFGATIEDSTEYLKHLESLGQFPSLRSLYLLQQAASALTRFTTSDDAESSPSPVSSLFVLNGGTNIVKGSSGQRIELNSSVVVAMNLSLAEESLCNSVCQLATDLLVVKEQLRYHATKRGNTGGARSSGLGGGRSAAGASGRQSVLSCDPQVRGEAAVRQNIQVILGQYEAQVQKHWESITRHVAAVGLPCLALEREKLGDLCRLLQLPNQRQPEVPLSTTEPSAITTKTLRHFVTQHVDGEVADCIRRSKIVLCQYFTDALPLIDVLLEKTLQTQGSDQRHHDAEASEGQEEDKLGGHLNLFQFYSTLFLSALWAQMTVLIQCIRGTIGTAQLFSAHQTSLCRYFRDNLGEYSDRSVEGLIRSIRKYHLSQSVALSGAVGGGTGNSTSAYRAMAGASSGGANSAQSGANYRSGQSGLVLEDMDNIAATWEESLQNSGGGADASLFALTDEGCGLEVILDSSTLGVGFGLQPAHVGIRTETSSCLHDQVPGRQQTKKLFVVPSTTPFDVFVKKRLIKPIFDLADQIQLEAVLKLLSPEQWEGAQLKQVAKKAGSKWMATATGGTFGDELGSDAASIIGSVSGGSLAAGSVVSAYSTASSYASSYASTYLPRALAIREQTASDLGFDQVLDLVQDLILVRKSSEVLDNLVIPLTQDGTWHDPSFPASVRWSQFQGNFRAALLGIKNGTRVQFEIHRVGSSLQQHKYNTTTSTDPSLSGLGAGTAMAGRRIIETLGSLKLMLDIPAPLKTIFNEEAEQVYSSVFSFLVTLMYAQHVLRARWKELHSAAFHARRTSEVSVSKFGSSAAGDSRWKEHTSAEESEKARAEAAVNHMLLFVIDSVLQFYLHAAHAAFAKFRECVQATKQVHNKDGAATGDSQVRVIRTLDDLIAQHREILRDLQHLSLSSAATQRLWDKIDVVLKLAIDPVMQEDRKRRPEHAAQRVRVAVGSLIEILEAAVHGELTGSSNTAATMGDTSMTDGSSTFTAEVARKTLPLLQVLSVNDFFVQ